MTKAIATVAATVAVAGGVAVGTAPIASACNDTNWTWPLCHLSAPSVPSFHVDGPRPPLTPKTSPWCTSNAVFVDGVDPHKGHFMLDTTYKHDLNMWPDYVTRHYIAWVLNRNNQWEAHPEVYKNVDCDA